MRCHHLPGIHVSGRVARHPPTMLWWDEKNGDGVRVHGGAAALASVTPAGSSIAQSSRRLETSDPRVRRDRVTSIES